MLFSLCLGCDNEDMRRYWFVLIALISVISGSLLNISGLTLESNLAWGFGSLFGFYFSSIWLIRAIKRKELGSDVLALLSISATALTNEWFAASIIALMLSTGRALENWAEGRASKHLDALISRVPQTVHLYVDAGETNEVAITNIPLGSRLLVRSGEVVPLDGILEIDGVFDESALAINGEAKSAPTKRTTPVDFFIFPDPPPSN
jgi:cation transport ATPase